MVLIKKQVRSDNDASEVGILGHFGTFWDHSEDFEEFGPFRLFSQEKRVTDPQTDGPTDPRVEMRGRI